MAAAWSVLGPLPRKASTESWDSHRSKTLTRDGSSKSAEIAKSRQPGAPRPARPPPCTRPDSRRAPPCRQSDVLRLSPWRAPPLFEWPLQLRPRGADEIIDAKEPKGTAVKLRDALDSIVPDPAAAHVYGQPYETADGVTVVPVARVRGRTKAGAGHRSSPDRETGRRVRHQERRGHLGTCRRLDPHRADG